MKNSKESTIKKIIEYYSEENLNIISRKIIEAYKNKKYSYLINLAKLIDKSIIANTPSIQKLFSHLIMQFHPDRISLYKQKISKLNKNNKDLDNFSHIIAVTENIDSIQFIQEEDKTTYDIEYEYGYDEEDFDSVIEENDFEDTYSNEDKNLYEFDFISLLRYRELGNIDGALPSFYFEELEGELALHDSNLFDLSGLEKCTNLEALDLSNNRIVDITPIGFLTQLAEINLSGNTIQDISVLYNLQNLEKIDISFNTIKDISPLFNLTRLKYVNIIGNNISFKQVGILKKKNRIIIY